MEKTLADTCYFMITQIMLKLAEKKVLTHDELSIMLSDSYRYNDNTMKWLIDKQKEHGSKERT